VRDHPATYLLNTESSDGVPARVARFASIYAYALRGNGYLYAPRDGAGELTALNLVEYGTVTMLRDGAARLYDFEDAAGVRRRVPARSMAHLRYMAADGWTGRSPLMVAAQSMGIALAGQDAAARTAAGGSARGVVKLSDYYESDNDRERNARRIKAALNDTSDGGWAVLGEGEDAKPLDLSAADQQLLDSRKMDREQIAAIYRMPPSKLQMLEHGVKANGEQQAIDYLTDCLMHWSKLIESQLDLAVLTRSEREAGMFLSHDFGALLQPTTKDQYDALTKAVGGPIMLPNEGRAKIGLPPVSEGETLNPAPNMTRDNDDAGGAADDDDDTEGDDE
jgi:HK97 family phage portal protein